MDRPRRLPFAFLTPLVLFSEVALAVWPFPGYWTYGSPGAESYQRKVDARSARSQCVPDTGGEFVGWCMGTSLPGKSCPGSSQLCGGPQPRIVSVSHKSVAGGQIQLEVEYDIPNGYCWTDLVYPDQWPTTTQTHSLILRLWDGASLLRTSNAVFESGRWMPTIGCPGTLKSLRVEVTRSCGSPASDSKFYEVGGDGCPTLDFQPSPGCPSGPGNVPLTPATAPAPPNGTPTDLASTPAFGESPIAGPLAPGFFYNGNNARGGTGMGPAWNFAYGQTLRTDGTGTLVWTDERGFRRSYTGSEGSGYTASAPGDAVGTVARSGSDYILSLPDGTRHTFVADNAGFWRRTINRWGNGAEGNTTSTARPTTVQELFGGNTTGRQISLAWDVTSTLQSITDTNSTIWNLTYDGAGRLQKICSPGAGCSAPWWRVYGYDTTKPVSLTSIRDSGDSVVRAYHYDLNGVLDQTWIGAATFTDLNAREKTQFVRTGSTVTVKRAKEGGGTVDTDYVVEPIAGGYRVTQISGACPECGEENSTTTYYPTTGRRATRVDGNGHGTMWSYDAYGNVIQTVEAVATPKERTTNLGYAIPGTDLMPAVWGNSVYDFLKTRSSPSGIKPASTTTTVRAWSGTGNLVLSETVSGYTSATGSAEDRTTTTTYDAQGRVLSRDGPRTDVTTDVTMYEYYTNGETSVPARNRLSLRTDPDGTQTQYDTYHALGGVTKQTRKQNAGTQDVDVVTESTFDDRGRLTKHVLKATTGAEPDIETWTSYDTRGRVTETKVLPTGGAVVSRSEYAYENGTDRLLTRTETAASGGAGDRVTYSYDDRGNVAAESYGVFNGSTTTTDFTVQRQYDGLCKVRRQIYPVDSATTRYDYDCAGNLTGIADANHYVDDTTPANLSYGYDELNRLSSVTRTAAPTPDVTIYGYDARDQLTSVTDANGNPTGYVHDDFGALRQRTTTLSGTGPNEVTTYSYDEANNLLSTTQEGVRGTVRTYDGADRLLTVRNDPASPTLAIDYTYDTGCLTDPLTGRLHGQGRICQVVDGSGTTTYGYDRRGLVVTERKVLLGRPRPPTVQYGYDAAGRRTEVRYPNGGKTTTSYDIGGRPTNVVYAPRYQIPVSILSSVSHKPFGPVSAYTTAGNVAETRTFDTRYRRVDQTTAVVGAKTLMSLAYHPWDKEGNLLAVDDLTPDSPPEYDMTFGYDPGRYTLTSATGPFGDDHRQRTFDWTYDRTGNRLTESNSDLGTTIYGYGTDGSGHSNGVLTSITPPGLPAIPIASLRTGDLQTDDGSIQYDYDALGRLERAQIPGPGCGSYPATSRLYHDAEGHRAASELTPCGSSGPWRTELNFYGTDGNLLHRERYAEDGSQLTRQDYVWLEGEPVAIIQATIDAIPYFLHGDHLGRPLAMTDGNGALLWRPEYEPFGRSRPPRVSLAFVPGLRFPGQWESEDSADVPGGQTGSLGQLARLTDNWHRTYKQEWGRYTQPDPLGASGPYLPGRSPWGENVSLPASALADLPFSYALANPLRYTDPSGLLTAQQVSCILAYGSAGASGGFVWGGGITALATGGLGFPPGAVVGTAVGGIAGIGVGILGCTDICSLDMARANRWRCRAKCSVYQIPGDIGAGYTEGFGTGKTEQDACKAAKKDASSGMPLGHRTKHCQCYCE
ncbi:MAG: RHS repeat protein [Acidobacteria bacterium ACB2]|nr:RHS repeat protein [Acidobacteria bacterium ACB2]